MLADKTQRTDFEGHWEVCQGGPGRNGKKGCRNVSFCPGRLATTGIPSTITRNTDGIRGRPTTVHHGASREIDPSPPYYFPYDTPNAAGSAWTGISRLAAKDGEKRVHSAGRY